MSFNNTTKIAMIRFAQSFHLYIHAYALILIERGLTLFQIGSLESLVIATVFIMEMPTGVIADRIGRKWTIAAGTAFMMSGEILFLFAGSYAIYVIISLLTGTGFAFLSGAIEALVYDSLPEENREDTMKQAMGVVNSSAGIAFAIAPIVGAFIIGDASPERFTLAIILTVVALAIGVLICLTVDEPADEWDSEKRTSIQIFKDGIAEVRGNQRLQRIIMLVIFTTAFNGTLIVTFAAPYLTQNEVTPFVIGIALSVGSLLAAVTQRYAYKVEAWLGQEPAVLLLLLLPGIMYGILAMVTGSILTVLVIIVMYGTNDMKAPLFSAYQNALIESKNRATVLSIISMCLNLFVAIVAPIYAAIAQYSFRLTFIIMGAVIILAALLLGRGFLSQSLVDNVD